MRLLLFVLLFCLACQSANQEVVDGPNVRVDHFSFHENWTPKVSAHRGGRNIPGYPENALETFRYVHSLTSCIVECDIAFSQDEVLFLMHDESIDRTTNGSGQCSELTWDELRNYSLVDDFGEPTDFKIPKLTEVLTWGKSENVAFTLDVKRGVPFEDVIELVHETGMQKQCAIITYTPGAARRVFEIDPEMKLSVTIRNTNELDRILDQGIPTKNMLAFVGVSEPSSSLYETLHARSILTILGTLGNLDRQAQARGDQVYQDFIANGADILATDRPLEVYAQILEFVEAN